MGKGNFLTRMTAERVSGKRPGAPRAAGAAVLVGTSAAAITYRLLRHSPDR